MNIITGYRGEPHITAVQDRGKNQGAFGVDSYILNVGQQLAAQIISANEVRIKDGVLCMQGCVANIAEGMYDTCTIANGTQGMQRRDLIVARYTKDADTNVEDISLVVIQGTPAASSPATPSYNSGNIQIGDSPVDFPLYRVNISGVTISSTTKIATNLRTQAETDTLVGSTSISGIGNGSITGAISTLNNKTTTALKTVRYTTEYSINGNGGKNLTANDFGISNPSGYNPVAVAQFSSGLSSIYVRGVNALSTGTDGVLYMQNTTSSAQTATAYITILYARTGLL